MSIRTKLLVLLLTIAVAPMLVLLVVGQVSTRMVGTRLMEATQRDLAVLAERRLLAAARAGAALAGSEAQTVELMVALQAGTLEAALASGPADGRLRSEVYFAREDFDEGARPVPGLEEETWSVAGGGIASRMVSRVVPSFVLSPGVSASAHWDEIEALVSLADLLRGFESADPGFLAGHYVAMESGVHMKYPGHGGYPEGFDPREREWYRQAMARAEGESSGPSVSWGMPIVDATTGRVMLTVSMAVRGPDGVPVGVAAVDLTVLGLLESVTRNPSWEGEGVFIGSLLGEGEGVGETSLFVYAERAYEDGARRAWDESIELETFALDDEARSREMVAGITANESGVVRGRHRGVELLVAYAPILMGGRDTATGLVLTVPLEEITAIADSVGDEFWGVIVTQLTSNLSIAALVAAGVVLLAFRGARTVTRPVEDLAEAVGRVADGDLEARAHVARDDEIGRLALNFNEMVPQLRDRVSLRNSLELAMEVQQALLPGSPPLVEGLDIAGRSIYCDETGGDYYDFLSIHPTGEGRVGIVMGDVTGHGIAAALLMTTARAIVRARIGLPGTLSEHLASLNAQLAEDNQHGRFMTMCVLVLDRGAGVIRWASAGHDSPLVYTPGAGGEEGEVRELPGDHAGIPLGIRGDWAYEEATEPMLGEGEILLVGTDGIWEARNDRGEMFGKERLASVMREHAGGSAESIIDAVVGAVERFRAGASQQDDITLVVVKGAGAAG